jgi:hypothetical protein
VKFIAYLWYLLFVLSEENRTPIIHLACRIRKKLVFTLYSAGDAQGQTQLVSVAITKNATGSTGFFR